MDLRHPIDVPSPRTGRGSRSVSIGPRILVPGYPQWSWGQRERALFLSGSFVASALVGALTWGTAFGLGMLGFAFVTHVVSAVDAIRQNAFPGFGRVVPTVTASAGLGVIFYAPALAMASVYAWPVGSDERSREGFLVNRWAYRLEEPKSGEMVWLRPDRRERSKVARILAGAGQTVEWVLEEFRVDDRKVDPPTVLVAEWPAELKLTIPEGHVLVVFSSDPRRTGVVPDGWEIVPRKAIRGRAWARSYPIWERGLLP